MKTSIYYLLCGILSLAACTTPSSESNSEKAEEDGPLAATFAAHGGIDQWRSYRTLAFNYIAEREDQRDTQQITTDLWDRRELIKGEAADIGYDGTNYWKVMHDSSAMNTNPTFMVNLQFYFFAMPFVLADPGVQATVLKPRSLGGKTYDVTKITFGDSVGVAPKDQYILYIDPASNRLEYMLYSVTYFNPDNAEKYGALYYSDWQQVEGLSLPRVIERYAWDNDAMSLGNARGSKRFEHITLSKVSKEHTYYTRH